MRTPTRIAAVAALTMTLALGSAGAAFAGADSPSAPQTTPSDIGDLELLNIDGVDILGLGDDGDSEGDDDGLLGLGGDDGLLGLGGDDGLLGLGGDGDDEGDLLGLDLDELLDDLLSEDGLLDELLGDDGVVSDLLDDLVGFRDSAAS